MQVLDAETAGVVRDVCELIVPGCARTGAEVYVDALLARMDEDGRAAALAAFRSLGECVAGGHGALAERQFTPEFGFARALACEAYYSDFVAAGRAGPGAWEEIGFAPPPATRIRKDWSYLGVPNA
jgi:hypothetical protein